MALPSINFINPFRKLVSSEKASRRGRALRSSFWDKLTATFDVFSGHERFHGFGLQEPSSPDHPQLLKETSGSHLGLWDIVTFGLPWAIGALLHIAVPSMSSMKGDIAQLVTQLGNREKSDLSGLSGMLWLSVKAVILGLGLTILAVPYWALEVTRLVAALAFTIAASPFVLIAHGISQAIRAYKIKRIETLEVTDVTDVTNAQPLNKWLTQHDLTINDVINGASYIEKSTDGTAVIFSFLKTTTITGGILNTSNSEQKFSVTFFKPADYATKEKLEDLADLSTAFNKTLSSNQPK